MAQIMPKFHLSADTIRLGSLDVGRINPGLTASERDLVEEALGLVEPEQPEPSMDEVKFKESLEENLGKIAAKNGGLLTLQEVMDEVQSILDGADE